MGEDDEDELTCQDAQRLIMCSTFARLMRAPEKVNVVAPRNEKGSL